MFESVSFSLRRPDGAHFLANGHPIPTVESGFIYLGMPIGHLNYVADYFSAKLSRVEKSFYMLRGLGCRAGLLSPRTIGFIYKQYCQSICRYGMENVFIDEHTLNILNVRQNLLLKHSLNLNSSALTTPLLQCLGVEQIPQLYFKHKLFGYKQFLNNDLSHSVFVWLDEYFWETNIPSKRSFFHQVKKLSLKYGIGDVFANPKCSRENIDNCFASEDSDLIHTVSGILDSYEFGCTYSARRMLNLCLTPF